MKTTFGELLHDIDKLGPPIYAMYHSGVYARMQTDGTKRGEEFNELELTLSGQTVLTVSTLGDVQLVKLGRPAFMVTDCRLCYKLVQEHTGATVGFLLWY